VEKRWKRFFEKADRARSQGGSGEAVIRRSAWRITLSLIRPTALFDPMAGFEISSGLI
jgi:hypothetical protein